ncbi:MAG: molybdenum-pterin-binding protein [Pirellula sp.]|nr:molybdenum-pterin-binding protein [Pirellula sp.]
MSQTTNHRPNDDMPPRRTRRRESAISEAPAPRQLLTPAQAACVLGIERTTLYGWLGLARRGLLVLGGRPFDLTFRQTGAAGQGRILLEAAEVERLREHLLVRPRTFVERRPRLPTRSFPGIHVPLGKPA